MIITFEGVQGSGKSMTSTGLAYSEHMVNGLKVISNNTLNFEYTHFDTKYFIEHIEDNELENCILLLDEAYLYTDSRSASTKLNKLMTYFIVQTRKRGVDLYICTHHIDHLDKRLRRQVDVRGTCRYKKERPCRQCGGSGEIRQVAEEFSLKKVALVKENGDYLPVLVTSKNTFRGRITYKTKTISLDEDVRPRRLEVKDSSLYFRDDIGKDIWDKALDEIMSKVNGNGHDDDEEPEQCPRCLGYGFTGFASTRFFDLRTGVRRRIRVLAPAVFPLYQTEERVPMTKKQMRVNENDL